MVDLSPLWSGRVGESSLAPEVWAFVKAEDAELRLDERVDVLVPAFSGDWGLGEGRQELPNL